MAKKGSLHQAAYILCVIGGILTIVYHVLEIVELTGGSEGIVRNLGGIVIGILVLMSTGILKSKKQSIPFEWWIMLIFVIVDALLGGNLGTVLYAIGMVLLLIDAF